MQVVLFLLSHLYTERSLVQRSPVKTKQNKANRRSSFLGTQRVVFCSLTHRYYLAENVLRCCDIDILHASYYIYGTLLYMKPPCKDTHTLMETLPLVQSMVASTSI